MRTIRRVAVVVALIGLATPLNGTVVATPATVAHGVRRVVVAPPALHGVATTQANPIWAGYSALGGGEYQSTWANWTQPSASCANNPSGRYAESSFWVGLDGNTQTPGLFQTGTDADCNGNQPVYYGWYELYPWYSSATLNGWPVQPGDHMGAAVFNHGGGNMTTVLYNYTRGWTFSENMSAPGNVGVKADVIAEDPQMVNGQPYPLAHFVGVPPTDVVFSAVAVNGDTFLKQPTVVPWSMVQGGVERVGIGFIYGPYGNTFNVGYKCC